MLDSLLRGALAGYAIAIPVGAIGLLILETGLERGFWPAFAAGSGAATADLTYALIAVTVGTVVAAFLAPFVPVLKIVSGGFLIALGALGVYRTLQARRSPDGAEPRALNMGIARTYFAVLSLTLLNPATIAYFAALILGGAVGSAPGAWEKGAFVVGAFLASWSWQSLIAVIGALAHRHLPAGFRFWTSVIGNVLIIAFGILIFL
jgi:arginine exporter protein ArgO